jgi:hypothetical protein
VSEYMTQDDCDRLRAACPVLEKVSGEDGIADRLKGDEKDNKKLFKDIMTELHSIDKRLSRIEWGFLCAVAAYTFFTRILPVLVKLGQASATSP